MDIFIVLDLLGTFVFAIAGAVRATRHRLDLLGVMVLAVATGVGGGMIRDMLLGATPVAAISDERYLFICLLGGLVVVVAARRVEERWNAVMIADAIGLGVFAAIGAAKAAAFDLGIIGVMMMGALTAVGGGVVRDVLVREIPAVVRHDFYASAALIGSAVFFAAHALELSTPVQIWSTVFVTTGLRFYAMRKKLSLPTVQELHE